MGAIRAGIVLAGFAGLTIPLLPVQELLLRFSPRLARTFPHWYHRQVCRLLGIALHVDGEVVRDNPVLLISNHTSWLDIPVLSAIAPVSFVAKREVSGWPGVKTLARLQRTVFVDRSRRTSVKGTANEIRARLINDDTLVLFAEGTSSDGNRILPFRSSLFAAVILGRLKRKPDGTGNSRNASPHGLENETPRQPEKVTLIQTVTIAYTRLHGVPLGRADRPLVGWYGDMEMLSHAWGVLKAGPLDVEVKIGAPVPVSAFKDRKDLARKSEQEVAKNLVRILRRRNNEEEFELVKIQSELRKSPVFKDGSMKAGGMR